MKRILILLVGFMAGSEIAFSQVRSDFKGPQAKNYKAWKHAVETTSVDIVTDQQEVLKGPKAKNSKRSLVATERTEEVPKRPTDNLLKNERLGMVGPRAKNYRANPTF